MEQVSTLIIQKLETMASAPGTDPAFWSKRKAVSALFPYAVRLAQDYQQKMINAILHVASNSTCGGITWHRIGPYITTLFHESSPPYLNRVITLVAPSVPWGDSAYTRNAVARWASAVLATPYSEVVGQYVVDALLQITYKDALRQEIPIDIWAWLKRRPSLPPVCRGRELGATSGVVRHIRGLGDIEILKSYFLLVWSEWNTLSSDGLTQMTITIREEFYGIAMRRHRKDLIKHLDHILKRLDQGVPDSERRSGGADEYDKRQYERLREVLLTVDRS